MSKRMLILVAAITALAVLAIPVVKWVKNRKPSEENNSAYGAYISGHTYGVISNRSVIRIILASEGNRTAEIGQPVKEELFSFSPSIEGKAVWIDSRTIEFRPEEKLPSGQEYEAEFELGKVMDVPSELSTFEFMFSTIKQAIQISYDGVTTTDKTTLRWQKLRGVLATADAAENDIVAQVLTARQNGKTLPVRWEHDPDQTTHRFTIDSISRKETADSILVEWSGSKIGAGESAGKEWIKVAPLGAFVVMDAKVVQEPEQYVSVQFSDPVMEKQDLNGLITLTDNPSLTYVIEDNEVRVYPASRQDGPKTINVETGVKNILGYSLQKRYTMELLFEQIKPAVRLVGKGVILPNSEGLYFPFEAVNLNAVDVKVIKIFENNIPQFLQVNNLAGERELKRVGKMVLKKTVPLTLKSNLDRGKWNSYSLDLASLIKTEPGAIYKIILSFKKEYSTFNCDGAVEEQPIISYNEEEQEEDDENWDYYGDYYYDDYYYDDYDYYGEYDYRERENPCHVSYYGRRRDVSRNVLASDLGLITKRGTDGSVLVTVADLKTTAPMQGTIIEVYDFQQQLVASSRTDRDGMAKFDLRKKPFLIVAKHGQQRGYLKMDDGSSLSLSKFDVSGEVVQKGIKGFIYGERGVWRPGDTLFLSFILEDKESTLPKNHPVTFELTNPRGQLVKRTVRTLGLNGFYDFTTPTDQDAPTGNWTARVKVGGVTFSKNIKVETIMPNRLKIKLDFGVERLAVDKDVKGQLQVNWLHGAPARNLSAKVEVTLNQMRTTFKKYEDYEFNDPSRNFSSESQVLFDGKVNENGAAEVKPGINVSDAAPGMLKAFFTVRAFEEGGGFSIDRFSMPYSPYTTYVGIKVPEGNKNTGMLVTDTNHVVKVVTVDADGKPVSRKLVAKVYKVSWRWWWDSYEGDLANYVGNSYNQPYSVHEFATANGKGQFILRVNRPEWGRFFIHVMDEEGGHATGQTVYIDWPAWAGSSPKGNEGATMLSFTADKQKYNVGENVNLTIPSSEGGRALISIESGSRVLKAFWTETRTPETKFSFPVTEEMTPNVYVNVSLVQPHAQTRNDLPIRLYGVIPLQVEDPNTHLTPVIKTAAVWRPEESASVTVSEKDKKEMTYTLAIVDEGLLDLTRFETPDPWSSFYAREALGVKTWDIYDMVMGAYGAQLERILAIGGDAEGTGKGNKKANRFKPMVKYLGPFHLKKGETQTKTFRIPQYVGSVRVMVVAGDPKGAYGSSDKTVPVRKPLMILGTLPRVVGPGETVDLPVTVFAMEKQVKNVNVKINPGSMFIAEEGTSKSVSFNEVGDQVVNFRLKVKQAIGIAKVKIEAVSGSEKATYEIELDVRNPNPKVVDVLEGVIEPGKTWTQNYKLPGMAGTNSGVVEISNIPPINLGKRLKYLIQYPHGCIEQTTSSVFPQLFLADIMELDANFKTTIDKNIRAGIQRIKLFQTSGGGLSYWPGHADADDWGSSYAGHFLLMAEKKGYAIPPGLLEGWKRYQKSKAAAWSPATKNAYYYYNNDLAQAYRLYTLALAKAPDMGAMNRLKENKSLSNAAKWRLAAAYVLAGQPETAKKLVNTLPIEVKDYRELSYTYGSDERDKAMILETLTLLNDRTKGAPLVKQISAELSEDQWMSTQTTAYCLIAVAQYAKGGASSTEMKYTINLNGIKTSAATKLPVKQTDMKVKGEGGGTVSITNNNQSGILFARIIVEGIPVAGDQTSAENNLKLNIAYTKMDGAPLDPATLEQGTDFIAEVTITNPGMRGEYEQMALTQIFPSGWEIHNMRMDEAESAVKSDYPTYQDIRDDRVYTYFNVGPNKTKTFRIVLNAAYTGKFYLPTVYCEAMYDNTINARKPGKWVDVVKPGTNP